MPVLRIRFVVLPVLVILPRRANLARLVLLVLLTMKRFIVDAAAVVQVRMFVVKRQPLHLRVVPLEIQICKGLEEGSLLNSCSL